MQGDDLTKLHNGCERYSAAHLARNEWPAQVVTDGLAVQSRRLPSVAALKRKAVLPHAA